MEQKLVQALLKLANAADRVGIEFFDTDDMPESVQEMQTATLEARSVIQGASL